MKRGIVMLLPLLGLAACKTDQARDVRAYRAIGDPPGDTPRHAAGQPLSVLEALRLTAVYNERMAIQGEAYVQALAQRQRFASALRPTIDFFAQTSLRENTGSSGVAQTSAGLTAQYRLLTGMSDLRNVEAAEARVTSREWLILDLREAILLETVQVYYDTLRAERSADVLESSVRAQQARLDDARARNEVGFTRPLDVAQIEAQVSRTRTQFITSIGQAKEGRAALELLTGAPLEGSQLADGFVPGEQDRDVARLTAVALQHRQDLVVARAEADAARREVDAAIGQYAPSIGVSLDWFLVQTPDESPAALASLIQLRVPLFSAGRIEADVRESWSIFRQRVLEYQLRRREVQRDITAAAAQLQASLARAGELATQVKAASQALALAEAAYQAGLGTNLERTTAQDQLLAAQLQATSEEFTTKTAVLSLWRACGLLSSSSISTRVPEPPAIAEPTSPLVERTEGGA